MSQIHSWKNKKLDSLNLVTSTGYIKPDCLNVNSK